MVLSTSLTAQSIKVGENVLVSRGLETRPLAEPHLVAHPRDPNHLLGATIVSSNAAAFTDDQYCAAMVSLDGGKTWTRHDFAIRQCGDPWVALTPQGMAVFTALASHASLADSANQLLVFVSLDGGRTWHDVPQTLGRGHDHQTLAVDTAGTVYVLSGQGWRDAENKLRWSVYVARARPTRILFDVVQRIFPSNLNINSQGLAVLADGSLVITYSDFQRNVDEFRRAGRLERGRTWALLSRDRGQSFSLPLFITESCGRGWTFLGADASNGPYRDRLYHVCVNRGSTAIQIERSEDRGDRWSDPVLVEAAAAREGARTHPQVAVNREGTVGVAWLDSRDDTTGRCYSVYFTASVDGGVSYLPSQMVSSAPSCPDSTQNGGAQGRWPRGGDYFGLAAAADGRFHVFWPDARGRGRFQVWTAAIEVNRGR